MTRSPRPALCRWQTCSTRPPVKLALSMLSKILVISGSAMSRLVRGEDVYAAQRFRTRHAGKGFTTSDYGYDGGRPRLKTGCCQEHVSSKARGKTSEGRCLHMCRHVWCFERSRSSLANLWAAATLSVFAGTQATSHVGQSPPVHALQSSSCRLRRRS